MDFVYLSIVWYGPVDRDPSRGISVRSPLDDRVARGDLPVHPYPDQPEPGGRKRQVVADHQWETVEAREAQIEQLMSIAAEMLQLTRAIFTAAEGGSIRKSFGPRHFKPAAKRAKLLPLRFHDLRHTSAGLMIALGAHPKVIQERLGHSSIKVTLDVYGHLFPNLDEALAQALDELARQSAASSPPKPANVLAFAGRQ
jgi:integrase